MTPDELNKMQNHLYVYLGGLEWLQAAVMVVCVSILFGCYHKLRKPMFVWVIWALLVVSELAVVAGKVLYMVQLEETSDRLSDIHDEEMTLYIATAMSGQWVFGIKYAEVVLKLPLLVFPEKVSDIQRELKKISWAVWTLNGSFAALVIIYTLLLQLRIFGVLDGDNSLAWINHLNIVMYILPTVLLLMAVIKVRCMASQLRNKAIFQKEKLILLHTILFTLFVTIYTAGLISKNVAMSAEYAEDT